MYHSYRMESLPRLRCSVTTIVGEQDTEADQRPWRELTEGAFREVIVPGAHFYLIDSPPFSVIDGMVAAAMGRGAQHISEAR